MLTKREDEIIRGGINQRLEASGLPAGTAEVADFLGAVDAAGREHELVLDAAENGSEVVKVTARFILEVWERDS